MYFHNKLGFFLHLLPLLTHFPASKASEKIMPLRDRLAAARGFLGSEEALHSLTDSGEHYASSRTSFNALKDG